MTDHVEVSTADGIATIRMARADKKNALTQATYAAMAEGIAAADRDDAVRAILILGVPGAFSAGNDIQDFLALIAKGQGIAGPVLDFLRTLIGSATPLVAGVDGAAVGVGTTMLMHCDHVVASDRSVFATPFVDLGIVPEAASSLMGPRIMGHQRAFELLALGRRWDARRAEAAGLVGEVVAPDALEARARAVAAEIAAKPAGAMKEARALLRGDIGEVLRRMEEEAALFRARLASPEAQAAFMAFMSRKR